MFYLSSSAAKNQGGFCLILREWNDWWTYKNLFFFVSENQTEHYLKLDTLRLQKLIAIKAAMFRHLSSLNGLKV